MGSGDGTGMKLHWQIMIALALAVVLGALVDEQTSVAGVQVSDVCDFVGTLFLRALKMLVVPLILSSIISGVAALGETGGIGRLAGKTAGYYLFTSAVAVTVGLVVANVAGCGLCDGRPCSEVIGLSASTSEVTDKVAGRGAGDVVGVFLRLVPENVVADAAEGQMLGLIFFAILFGFFTTRLPEEARGTMQRFWTGMNDVMLMMTDWVMKFAPVGVFGLVAKVVLTTGLAAFLPLLCFFTEVVVALLIHATIVLPSVLLIVGINPLAHFRAVAPAILMAFSTASSSATLPLTMECLQDKAGVSRRVTSFTLPLGATVNMDGTALYECVAALFIAQAYGLDLGFAQQFLVVAIALLTSIGVAGIPAASLVAITLILTTIGLPLEAVGLILAVDRVLDMARTAVNVFSDSTAAVVIARSEGESGVLGAPAP